LGEKNRERLQERAVTLLLSEKTIERAAKRLNVTRQTLHRWMREPEFRAALTEAKCDLLKTATRALTRNSAKAAEVLGKIFMGRPRPNQSANVSAAIGTLRLALDAFALENLDERLRKLENQNNEPF
jgi:transposase-like protein